MQSHTVAVPEMPATPRVGVASPALSMTTALGHHMSAVPAWAACLPAHAWREYAQAPPALRAHVA